MSYTHGRFVWFDCVTNDVKKASEFYVQLFGWSVETIEIQKEQTYQMIKNGDSAIGGLLPPAVAAAPPHWMSYLSVGDVETAADEVTNHGGIAITDTQDIPGVGRTQLVADPHGGMFHLFKGESGDPDNHRRAGHWHWNELWTTDVGEALTFYTQTFGLEHQVFDMGADGNYDALRVPNEHRHAGVISSPLKDVPVMWLPYVRVDNCDATAKRVSELGGTVRLPPTDVSDGARFCIFSDPTGTVIGAVRPPEND